MRLLFVEDNPFDFELAVSELRAFGFEFECTRVETLDALREQLAHSWSAVISDFHFPGFTGQDVLHLVREQDRELPFIVLSGHVGEELAVELMRAGASDYVTKDRIGRLAPSLERELRDVQLRQERLGLFTAWRRSEDRYRHIFESAPIGVAVTTPHGTVLTINEHLAAILGAERESLVGANIAAFAPGAELDPEREQRFEQTYVRRDGTAVRTSVTIAPLHSEEHEVEQIVWLVTDITAQHDAEHQMRSYRQQLEEAQRIARIGSYEYDFATGRRVWSDELYRIYGLDPLSEPDLGRADERIHPDDLARVRERRVRTLQTRTPYFDEHRVVLPCGEVRTVADRSRIVHDEDGRPIRIVGVVQDVTEARLQEDELQRRAMQQVVIANLGQAALGGEPIDRLLRQVAESVTHLLGVELCAILQAFDGGFRLVGGAGWNDDIGHGAEFGPEDVPQVACSAAMNTPIVVDLSDHTHRFESSPFLRRHGVTCGITVPISAARVDVWGVLGAHTRSARQFSTADVDFLRSIATVLAQAVERDRVDQQIVLHAAQQSAIAELSRIALKSVDEAVAVACNVVRDVLDADDARFFEFIDDGLPVFSEQTVAVPAGHFGVLTASARRTRAFSDSDLEFLQSVANILADSMDRERARRALAASEQRYREVVEGASEIIFTVSTEGVVTSLNAAFTNITGLAVSDWLGRPFQQMLSDDDARHTLALFHEIVAKQHCESAVVRIAGRTLEVTSFPKVEDGRTTAVYGFARDVTEARRAEEERQRVKAKLEQADRLTSLGRLAATVAHEFNNVLMGISPFVEVLRRGRNVESSLDHIGRAVKRGKRITQDILRFTQPAEPVRAAFDVATWMDNIALEAGSLVPSHCTIVTRIDPALRIDGDANQLQQIFTNLILNARDAMPDGGTLRIEVRREAPHTELPFGVVEHVERFAHCIVGDTGCGMAPETLRHIFEPLFTTKKNGTGLGLPVTHQVVQRHGGDIFVESELGRGTTFHIFLPLAEPAEARAPEPAFEMLPSLSGARRVLLVEDDESVAMGLVTLLEMDGLAAEIAGTGAAALQSLAVRRPDVVVLDVGLPDMEGTAVYAILAERHPDLPVIFSTGHADRAQLDPFVERQNVAYLLKPYDGFMLLNAIQDVMQSEEAALTA